MGGMQSVEEAANELGTATDSLIESIGGLTDADARGPSLLPGWTRGHVLTHLARNADGGTRLLGWARTGIPSYEYESVAARAEAIEAGAALSRGAARRCQRRVGRLRRGGRGDAVGRLAEPGHLDDRPAVLRGARRP